MILEKLNDLDFYKKTITSVKKTKDGYEIEFEDAGMAMPYNGTKPKEGDIVTFYGKGSGHPIRGIDLNGKEIFYETQEMWDEREQKKEPEGFTLNRYEERISALPVEFQERFQEFHKNVETFKNDFGAYELLVCEQAVLISRLNNVKEIEEFAEKDLKEQKELVTGLLNCHSKNTLEMSCHLAKMYLRAPKVMHKIHGSLCAAHGCDKYGCNSAYSDSE